MAIFLTLITVMALALGYELWKSERARLFVSLGLFLAWARLVGLFERD